MKLTAGGWTYGLSGALYPRGHKPLQSSPETIDYGNLTLPPACIKLVKDHLELSGLVSIRDDKIMET